MTIAFQQPQSLYRDCRHAFRSASTICAFVLSVLIHSVASGEVLDKIVAVVGDGVVLHSELTRRTEQIRVRLQNQSTPAPPESVLRERVLEQLISEQIQLQLAERVGIRVSPSELSEAIENIAKRNGMDLQTFASSLKNEGVTLREAREQIKTELLLGRLRQKMVVGRVRVTEAQVRNYLKSTEGLKNSSVEYQIGHILIAVPENADDNATKKKREEIEDIAGQISSPAEFRQTAVARSDGQNALEGGVIGWRKANELPTLAAEVIPTLAVGEVSQVLKTSSGFHLVMVLAKRGDKDEVLTEYQVRQIVINKNALLSGREVDKKINGIYQKLQAGENFAKLATAHSDDAISASDGGLLGWLGPNDRDPEFNAVLKRTRVGAFSKPFNDQNGKRIIQVVATREKNAGDELRFRQARSTLQEKAFREELQNWLRELREETYVDIKEPLDA